MYDIYLWEGIEIAVQIFPTERGLLIMLSDQWKGERGGGHQRGHITSESA